MPNVLSEARSEYELHPATPTVTLAFPTPTSQSDVRTLIETSVRLGVREFDITVSGSGHETVESWVGEGLRRSGLIREKLTISARIGLGTQWCPSAGYTSRKRILSGLDGVLRRAGLDFLDVLYVHRLDPTTPFEETMEALSWTVQQGKAMYAGVSALSPRYLLAASRYLRSLGTPLRMYQSSYSLSNRWVQKGVTDILRREGIGLLAAAPLAHGLLTSRTCTGATSVSNSFPSELSAFGARKGWTVEEVALSWVCSQPAVTSVLIGSSSADHVTANVLAAEKCRLTRPELQQLDELSADYSAWLQR
ncbi:aldo/keto reductase [Streptomyces sp. PTY087I2]|uniref:aldo/keto reductase n=1 Tax=Streptomyces sp. PTY087I2 TaxID=1819298 RepID=UPI0008282F30|nr:L-glyceraldehyde 3-phosphate reductase [Streptomyces sp. PTY087I2]